MNNAKKSGKLDGLCVICCCIFLHFYFVFGFCVFISDLYLQRSALWENWKVKSKVVWIRCWPHQPFPVCTAFPNFPIFVLNFQSKLVQWQRNAGDLIRHKSVSVSVQSLSLSRIVFGIPLSIVVLVNQMDCNRMFEWASVLSRFSPSSSSVAVFLAFLVHRRLKPSTQGVGISPRAVPDFTF